MRTTTWVPWGREAGSSTNPRGAHLKSDEKCEPVSENLYWMFSEKGGHWVSDSECEKGESFSTSKTFLSGVIWVLGSQMVPTKEAPEFNSVTCYRP